MYDPNNIVIIINEIKANKYNVDIIKFKNDLPKVVYEKALKTRAKLYTCNGCLIEMEQTSDTDKHFIEKLENSTYNFKFCYFCFIKSKYKMSYDGYKERLNLLLKNENYWLEFFSAFFHDSPNSMINWDPDILTTEQRLVFDNIPETLKSLFKK